MLNKIIADVLVIIHFGFIIFVVLGGLSVLKYRWMIVFHIPAVIWGALLEFRGWYCPLTGWEKHFRRAADQSGYSAGFVEHYLIPLIYPAGLTSNLQIVLGGLTVAVNVLIYTFVAWTIYRKKRRSFSKKQI